MLIAVTGARGRLGRATVDAALSDGHGVISIDLPSTTAAADERPGVVVREADATSHEALANAMVDAEALIHLAGVVNPYLRPGHDVHNINVTASYNALDVAASTGITHVCLASSVNAIGGIYSSRARYDYFPLDENHPTYCEDPYSLSKWICEAQAAAFSRRHASMTISSLRLHAVVPDHESVVARSSAGTLAKAGDLWGCTSYAAATRACLLSLTAGFRGHEVFYIVAPLTTVDTPSLVLRDCYFPEVPVTGDLTGRRSFYDSTKAERLLGWRHDSPVV